MTSKEAYEALQIAEGELWDALVTLGEQKQVVDLAKIRAYDAREEWHRIREEEERNGIVSR